ncbi:MAG: DUF1150 family protein [Hyphomicrobiaceae bacterium]
MDLPPPPIMSEKELAHLGEGHVAYIRQMTSRQARRLFPGVQGLPRGIDLFSLHSADGTPIALTDSWQAALGHAVEGELEVASLH